jgi:hypothetical protein
LQGREEPGQLLLRTALANIEHERYQPLKGKITSARKCVAPKTETVDETGTAQSFFYAGINRFK